ncbi:MAG TPA: glycosyltransferase, partial [Candidatus Tumulicola sp.]|nr:glycosyltransferase [Candidatus Tumulicola sp.]
MRVALDAQLTVGTATGIGEYVRGLETALRARGTDVVELREPGLDPWRFDRRVLWDQILLPARARACGADVLHCASGTVPLRTGMPAVVTVHDVAWLRVQAHARPYARYYFGAFSLARYRRARFVLVDSKFSRDEFLEVAAGYDPARVAVVYPGVAGDFARLTRTGGDGRTVLAVGTVERRKNLELLIRLLPELPQARLIAIGPATPYRDVCASLARSLGVFERVEFRGYVERSALLDLYRTCAAVAVPSAYEGFGYAAAQALCAGAPCVVSDRGALPEIAGGAAVAPLDDRDGWIEALRAALAGEADAHAATLRRAAIERF